MKRFGIKYLKNENSQVAKVIYSISNGFIKYSKNMDKLNNHSQLVIISGRCPSTKFNMIHLKVFKIISEIQRILRCEVIIPIASEEVFLRKNEAMEIIKNKEKNNITLIEKCNIINKRFKFISNASCIDNNIFNLALDISKHFKLNELKNILGDSITNPGLAFIPFLECAEIIQPITEGKKVLIISNLSQDPYLRMVNKYIKKKELKKFTAVFYRGVMDLRGGKRTTHDENGALYYEDSKDIIKNKINNSFTGGRVTKEEQIKEGGNYKICPVFDYISIFSKNILEIKSIKEKCKRGEILCGNCKKNLIRLVKEFKCELK